jgi:cell division protein FtsI/penicillin-binding protein 2
MAQFPPILIVSALLLLPLIPAAILYLLLSPKRSRDTGRATGEIGTIAGIRVQFNVVGSTATYVVLLIAATYIYLTLSQEDTQRRLSEEDTQRRLSEEATQRDAMRDQQAWLVEVPVMLENANNQQLTANNGELQQVRVELEPALTTASANTLQFWVVPNKGRFPTARFSITNLGVRAEVLDLNGETSIERDSAARKMEAADPVWLELGTAYAASGAVSPP